VNKCGNFIGRMTASFNESFAASRPATSSHFIFGVSDTMAPVDRSEGQQEEIEERQTSAWL